MNVYADGRPYRWPRARFDPLPFKPVTAPPLLDLRRRAVDWPGFWAVIDRELIRLRFQRGTRKVYRQVLRGFRAFQDRTPRAGGVGPGRATAQAVRDYLLGRSARPSASWLSVRLSVLRTALDKFGGLSVTEGLVTPRRRFGLGTILSAAEVGRMIESAPTLRDRLLVGLLYGCGLSSPAWSRA